MAATQKISLPEDGSLQKVIAAAKSPEKGPDYFVVLGYAAADSYSLIVVAEGPGSWDEASKSLNAKDGGYVFLRKDHKVEMAKTVKFAFVDWFPAAMPLKRRLGLQTVKKQVVDLLKPLHFELQASELSDVDQKTIDAKIGFVSGTASHVAAKKDDAPKDAAAAAAPAAAAASAAAAAASPKKDDAPAKEAPAKKTWGHGKTPSSGAASAAPAAARPNFGGGGAAVKAADDAAWSAALKDVRDDKKETNWLVATYDGGVVTLVGTGSDGFTGLVSKIDDAAVTMALLRVREVIDGKSNTTKFVFIKAVPASVKPLKRADVATKSGAIEKFFGQAHVTIDVTSASELSEQMVMDKVGQASGNKSNVRGTK